MPEPDDVFDRVSITPGARDAWVALVCQFADSLPPDVDIEPLVDVHAKVMPDGSLLFWVEVSGYGEVSMTVPADEWAWADGRN